MTNLSESAFSAANKVVLGQVKTAGKIHEHAYV